MLLAPYVFTAILWLIVECLEENEVPQHYGISEHILRRYNRDLIPKKNLNESVVVRFSMELYQIIEVNEPQQYLMLNSWIVERWVDSMLGWDPDSFDGVTEIMIPHSKIWLPDTTLYNSLTVKMSIPSLVMDESATQRLLNAKLTSSNESGGAYIEMLYPTIYKLSCNLDLRFFPFDVQVCKLTFGSWTFDNTYIDYFPYNASQAIGISNCIENEGWHVLGTIVERKELKYTCCPNNYTLLDFYIHIQRKPLYYVINLITPTSIITLISIVGFFSSSSINELRQEKITLGITTLLSMSILILMVSDKMPSTSSFIPLIGWFYTFMILLISVATLAASMVIYVQKQGIIGKPPPAQTMRWARRIGKLVRMELPLLMKQAYAAKAREEKLRMGNRRKQSLWQKVYKMSKMTLVRPNCKRKASCAPCANMNLKGRGHFTSSIFGSDNDCQRKFGVISNSLNSVQEDKVVNALNGGSSKANLPNSTTSEPVTGKKSIVFNLDQDKISESPSPLKSSLVDLTPMIDDDETPDDYKPLPKKPGRLLWTQSCASYDTLMKNVVDPITVNPYPISPGSERRNLAQLEYDWLAAVVERICFIVFLILFVLMSFGINGIGLYYWWTAEPNKHEYTEEQ